MKIYTKTGDKGETSLYGGDRVAKNSQRIITIGELDELNASIGLAIAQISHDVLEDIELILEKIQSTLFVMGSDIATPITAHGNLKKVKIMSKDIEYLEVKIDKYDELLPKMTHFILPGGSVVSSHLHLSRAICRRAERSLVQLLSSENINPLTLKYLNRLSDLLFVLARFCNKSLNYRETKWLSH